MSESSAGNETTRYLIVNADDFGLSEGINRGIIEAHETGIVTSASLMVRYPGAHEAAAYAQSHPALGVGLHFDVGEWYCRKGQWQALYEVIDSRDRAQVRAELERQLEEFTRLLGRPPTHLDSHQHIHNSEPARAILLEYASRLHVPIRNWTNLLDYQGDFYGQTADGFTFAEGISQSRLTEIIATLTPGWTELACHPGYAHGLTSIYASEREEELRILCSPESKNALKQNGVRLASFKDYVVNVPGGGIRVNR